MPYYDNIIVFLLFSVKIKRRKLLDENNQEATSSKAAPWAELLFQYKRRGKFYVQT
jgi:hypothetical protein